MPRAQRSLGSTVLAATSLAALLLLSACGGGSSAGGGSGTAFTRGAITDKTAGTITVNGVSLAVGSGTTVRIEKQAGGADDLRKGMIVTVHGTFDDRTGTATEIEFEDAVTGKVDDKGTDFVSVGGTRVNVDDSTEFADDALRLGSVAVGDRVRISGVPDDRGGLRASRVDDDAGTGDELELKGYVSGLGAGVFTLKLSPDADAASGYAVTLAPGASLPAGIANGSFVEVRSAGPIAGGAIVATSVSLEDRRGDASGDELELEGIVTSGTSAEFVVDGVTVRTSGATRWLLGDPVDLAVGTKVEVEGPLDAAGVLQAEKVAFRAVIRLQGAIAGYVRGASGATFTLLGIPVSLGLQTELDGVTLDGLASGDVVELRGMPDRTGAGVIGLRIRSRTDDRIFVRALVTSKNEAAGTLTLLGLTVQTDGGTEFRDSRSSSDSVDGPVMTPAAFFAAVEAGHTVVKARGRDASALSGTTLIAEEVEVEGEDD